MDLNVASIGVHLTTVSEGNGNSINNKRNFR